MRAWRVVPKGWTLSMIVPAETRGQATTICVASARDAGYTMSYPSFRTTRAPEYDEWAQTKQIGIAPSEEYVKAEISWAEEENDPHVSDPA